MKKVILFSVVLATMSFLINSCAKNTNTELTDEQKATIEKEVKDETTKLVSTRSQLNFDTYKVFFSEDEFISAVLIRGYIPTYSAWKDSIVVGFARRTQHKAELQDVRVTVLAKDLAIVTTLENWENWYKNGNNSKSKGVTSILWKKEQNIWKIIYYHQSEQSNK